MDKKILIIAGEASADMHGSVLVSELKKLDPSIEVCGIGGDNMAEAGVEIFFHMREMAFMGFVEVVKHLPFIKKVKTKLLDEVKKRGISKVILIDYPGFNLNISANLKKMGVDTIYYISPQIWAWHQSRIKKIKKYINKMLVVFPFEEKMYRDAGVDAEFVGHPLIERINNYNFLTREELYAKHNLDPDKEILLVLPGSRTQEIERIFPEVIKAATKISAAHNMQTIVAHSQHIEDSMFDSFKGNYPFTLVKGNTYDLFKHAKFGIIKSGTSTLETGLFGLPFIVVYRTSWLTFEMGKRLVKVNNIAMANIIAGETIVDELIQDDVNVENITNKVGAILEDKNRYDEIKKRLADLRNKLGGPGASALAAKIIYNRFNEN
ncbi:MAG: lipid-A-disaccharide synthase [Melioribacteraceae bacterium]|nr:MAG: lipid-A-disaccharide synthase [Melioribacteraceae bacterium]